MIVVPLVLMPLLLLGIGGLGFTLAERADAEVVDVMVLGGETMPDLLQRMDNLATVRLIAPSDDYRQRIADKQLQAVLKLPGNFAEALVEGKALALTIYTYDGEPRSATAVRRLELFLEDFRIAMARERLRREGLPETLVEPFQIKRENVAPPERVTGALLGGLLPYILIMLCITGAIYPAMDLTAGEKERGTMETLLSSPVSRTTLVLGKFLVVFTFSAVTALLAIAALGGSFWVAVSFLQATGALIELALSPMAIVGFFILLLPVAALFSAILLALSLFARTFREAQTYVSPLMILAVLPAGVALMPGVELTSAVVLVPVLNISLIGRDLLSGIYDWGYILAILLSSSLYAALALWLAVRLFHREEVVFRG
jgi:sodium transport system permease protein